MEHVDFAITDDVISQLALLLGWDVAQVEVEDHADDTPTTVRVVSLRDRRQHCARLFIKDQEDRSALRLYTHYLRPFDLNSPHYYGYLEVDGRPFLVMDHVPHLCPDWGDPHGYLRALDWLIKKDRATAPHIDALRQLDCFGARPYDGVPYWLAQFERWARAAAMPEPRYLASRVAAHQARLDAARQALDTAEALTVVHGDLHLSNVLFGAHAPDHPVFVIDWTQSHIGSVTTDLAFLYDNAPPEVRDTLLTRYQAEILVPQFDELFVHAKLLRDIGYLAWMADVICDEGPQSIAQEELDRVVASVKRVLG